MGNLDTFERREPAHLPGMDSPAPRVDPIPGRRLHSFSSTHGRQTVVDALMRAEFLLRKGGNGAYDSQQADIIQDMLGGRPR